MRISRIKLVTELMRLDMTQEQLAKRAGLSRVTVNSIIGGKSCSDKSGIKIADALGVPIGKLLEK